jgi:hypothetical protein
MFFERSASRDVTHLVAVERAVLQRVGRVPRPLHVPVAERICIGDQGAALRQVAEVRLQRRRVHDDEHLRLVAGRQDVVVGEVDLETRDAWQRSRRSANLGREIGQGRQVVAEERRLGGETAARQLNPIARVAGKANHHRLELLDPLDHPFA